MAVLPQEMVTRIGRAYALGQKWLIEQGEQDPESVEVALAVEAHRWFWKPPVVRTLLLTNQRKLTTQDELGNRVKSGWINHHGSKPADSFVRDFYCLGYGEPDLVPTLDPSQNEPDLSLWHPLCVLADFEDLPPRASLAQRLEWKVRLLRRLEDLGVWVVESTLHGGRGERQLLRAWWEKYGSFLHEDAGSPRMVAFGKTLYDELQAAGITPDDFVYHPRGIHQPSQQQHQEQALRHIQRLSAAPQT